MRRSLLDRIRDMEERIARLEASGATGLSGTDQTIKASHDRLDNIFGPGSLGSVWFNRYRMPATPNANDAEMTAAPAGNWSWITAPSSINASSNVSYTVFPHWMYVYIYGSGAGVAELRCTDPGNLPRTKQLLINVNPAQVYGAGGWKFTMRSVVDSNNYIEWVIDATVVSGPPIPAQAWYATGGTRTQVGSDILLYPPCAVCLRLGNYPSADYLIWEIAQPWGADVQGLSVSTVPGQRAANVNYLQLLFDQANNANLFARYFIDYVRFSASW